MKHLAFLLGLTLSWALLGAAEKPAFVSTVSGKGSPVLLIPGLSCSGEVWDATVAHLKDRHECHVLTLAGFAGVPGREGAFLAPAAEAIAAYVRERRLEKPVLIGHSLGGVLALEIASRNPDLVGKLAIVDAYPFLFGIMQPGITRQQAQLGAEQIKAQMDGQPDDKYVAMLRAGTYTRMLVRSDADHDKILAWGLASDRRRVSTAMADLYARDLRDDLGQIKSPVLVMAAWQAYKDYTDHDRIEASVRSQYAKVTNLTVAINDTANHFIMYDEPSWFYGQLDAFLAH